ncbi:MAG: hypothetical protein COB92_00745 [Robiginitomaculum sp.]|nr:MAG: hypothetical protein COB92_00745 [Robiginitomaculum sp.]
MALISRIKILTILLVAFIVLLPTSHSFLIPDANAGEKVKKVKPPKAKRRPNLSYRPNVSRMPPKYTGRVGVLGLRDKRAMLFYGGEDIYFSEPVLNTLSSSLYLEIKASRAFEQVKRIPGKVSNSLTRKDIKSLAAQHHVDYIFIADLTTFNLLREKMNKSKRGLDFKINVRFGVFGQLIDTKTGAVLWAETIEREDGQLNTDKRVSAEDYGPSAINAIRNGFDDMKNSLRYLGLEVKK